MAKAENPGIHSTTGEKLDWMRELREEALHAGTAASWRRQRESGKLWRGSARSACATRGRSSSWTGLVAPSRVEFRDARPSVRTATQVVTGYGDDLRPPCVRLQPGLHRVRRVAVLEVFAEKICKVMDFAAKIEAVG